MYTYSMLCNDLRAIKHSSVKVFVIGQSRLNRKLYAVRVGSKGGKQIIISGGIHAREHISSYLVIKQLFHAIDYTKEIERVGGIIFVPMLNPDGNMLCFEGLKSVPIIMQERIKALNNGSDDFSLWKANAYGVDLNVNFDAKWGTGRQNVFLPASQNYVGACPFSEPETRAIASLTKKVNASSTISYHCKGRELYWEFGQSDNNRERDKRLALYLNESLQYEIKDDDGTSAGGYKDYCILKHGIPSFTIELVDDKKYSHPILDYSCAVEDIKRNLTLPLRLLNHLYCNQ